MRTNLQERETSHCNITILVDKFMLMPQAMKIPAAKAAVDKEWEKLEKIPAWGWRKSEVKKEVIDEARTSGATVHFASLMDICHLKDAELEAKHQKYKGRVVFWGVIVKEILDLMQCSLIKVHQHHKCQWQNHGYHFQTARLRRTSSGCSIWLYPGKNGRCSSIIENSKNWMSRHLDSSTTTHMAEICTVILRQTIMGKAIWDVSLYIAKKDYFYLCTWWKLLNKEVDLGEPTSFFDHVYLGCTQRQCEISKDIGDNYRTMFESRVSAERKEKLPYSENRASSWSYDREGHAKKCVERYCEVSNKTTQQLHKVSTPCIDDHHFKEEEFKSVGEMSKLCSQIGTDRKTWYSMVSEQICTINYKMDEGLWQTPESIDFIYSSYMWIQTILSCG